MNLSRAAERLGIRQPTLSVSLSKLENTLGAKLLTRTKKGVVLTEAGQVFHAKAQDLFQVWKDLKNQTGEQEQNLKDYPDLEFSLEHDFSRKITESVIGLKLDLGIVVNPVQHPDLIIKKLCKEKVTFGKSEKMEWTKISFKPKHSFRKSKRIKSFKNSSPLQALKLPASSLNPAQELRFSLLGSL